MTKHNVHVMTVWKKEVDVNKDRLRSEAVTVSVDKW